MSTADPGEGGCLRKWWYQYIRGLKPPPSDAQAAGIAGHAEVENYLLTGQKHLSAKTITGLHFVPEPGKDLLVEWDVLHRPGVANLPITEQNSHALLQSATLRANGVPVLGFIDLVHARGTNKGTENPSEAVDPPGTVEVCDWKFVASPKYLKSPAELRHTMQMVGYGKWVYSVRPETTMVRLSHGYFITNGRSRKITTLVGREEIDRAWEHADGIARSIGHAAKETNPDKVPANLDACDSYGGCMHRTYCTAGMDQSLVAIMGATSSKALLPQPKGLIPVPSLLKAIKDKAASASPQTVSTPEPSAVALEQARLAAEEKMARLRLLVPPGFQEACDKVRAFGRGFPGLAGAAAQAFSAMGGQDVAPDFTVPGQGLIDYVVLTDPAQMAQLVADLAEDVAANPVSPIPPDAPASNPALASDTGIAAAAAAASAQNAAATMATAATTIIDNGLQTTRNEMVQQDLPKVAQMPADSDPMKSPDPAPKAPKAKAPKAPKATKSDGTAIFLFIDCRASVDSADLRPWVEEFCARIASAAGADDILSGGENSAIGYNKWEGAVSAMARSAEHTPLEPGYYHLDTRGSRVLEVVANALKSRIEASGGLWARSAR